MNNKGTIFIITMAMALVLSIIGVSSANMVFQDAHMIKRLKYNMQAQYLAEAGINHSLAEMAKIFDVSVFPVSGTLSTGSYNVTYTSSGGRILVSSTGTVPLDASTTADDVKKVVTAEIKSTYPTSLNYIMSAGNDLKIMAGSWTITNINGKMHANNKVELKALGIGIMDIAEPVTYTAENVELHVSGGWLRINGTTHTSSSVNTGGAWQSEAVTFPNFDYAYYKQIAVDNSDYYSSDVIFDNATLAPGGGIIYVDGIVTFKGTCTLTGSIIADAIKIESYKTGSTVYTGTFIQRKSSLAYDFVVAKLGNIEVGSKDKGKYRSGHLDIEAALVYAVNDIQSIGNGSIIDVTGSIVAGGNVNLWDHLTYIQYTHEQPTVEFGPDEETLKIVSWNT
jgi:hypothetical protein